MARDINVGCAVERDGVCGIATTAAEIGREREHRNGRIDLRNEAGGAVLCRTRSSLKSIHRGKVYGIRLAHDVDVAARIDGDAVAGFTETSAQITREQQSRA